MFWKQSFNDEERSLLEYWKIGQKLNYGQYKKSSNFIQLLHVDGKNLTESQMVDHVKYQFKFKENFQC